MRHYFLVLEHTEPDRYHPEGAIVFRGFFHAEEELETRLQDGTYTIFHGQAQEGEAPKNFKAYERRKPKTPKPRVTIEKL
jgi:hypothetical protein